MRNQRRITRRAAMMAGAALPLVHIRTAGAAGKLKLFSRAPFFGIRFGDRKTIRLRRDADVRVFAVPEFLDDIFLPR